MTDTNWLDEKIGLPTLEVDDEALPRRTVTKLIAGTGVTLSGEDNAATEETEVTIEVDGDSLPGYSTIQAPDDEELAQRSMVKFEGNGVSIEDDEPGGRTVVTIEGACVLRKIISHDNTGPAVVAGVASNFHSVADVVLAEGESVVIRAHIQVQNEDGSTTAGSFIGQIRRGATDLAGDWNFGVPADPANRAACSIEWPDSPGAGTFTYHLRASASTDIDCSVHRVTMAIDVVRETALTTILP